MFSITRLKNLLILLLALVLPLQGYAAAAMVFCGSENVVASNVVASPVTANHVSHAGMAHHQADAQTADQPAHDDHDHASHDKSSSSCSSCAACCVGAPPMHSPVATARPLPITHPLPFPLSGFVGYTPENPERPPSLFA
ncbi:hypothetical protein LT85_1612 [Collimonas arenae]|uniref:Uncharacterized protein n=1 Tax=Collimonas arenae TaxID=279058 RepID=A0A0A1FAK5_9BURK|nr:hypothetical protein [Collimonas arenae]AIY40770.1 hypothetical protein LT85_1612 [Collimonas arenae]